MRRIHMFLLDSTNEDAGAIYLYQLISVGARFLACA